uniref:Single stranded DNA binding protein 3 n=1 Tax=Salarias fasciatus TaxID=181472 RepID=A0A672I3G0_SALFA
MCFTAAKQTHSLFSYCASENLYRIHLLLNLVVYPCGGVSSGDMDGMNKVSNAAVGISNPPGTPRDDGELSGNFLHSFQSENYSPTMTMSV